MHDLSTQPTQPYLIQEMRQKIKTWLQTLYHGYSRPRSQILTLLLAFPSSEPFHEADKLGDTKTSDVFKIRLDWAISKCLLAWLPKQTSFFPQVVQDAPLLCESRLQAEAGGFSLVFLPDKEMDPWDKRVHHSIDLLEIRKHQCPLFWELPLLSSWCLKK